MNIRARLSSALGGRAARRRRHRRVALAFVLLAAVGLVLVVAGSGGDDGGDVGAGPSTTAPAAGTTEPLPDDPVARICALNFREIDTARSALLRDNESPAAVEGFLGDAFVDLARDRSGAIRALDPPPSSEVLAVLDDFDAVVDAIEADPSIGVASNPFAEVDARWAALGLDPCAMGSGTVPADG